MRHLAFFATTLLASSLAQAAASGTWNTVPFLPYMASADGSVVVGDIIQPDGIWRWTAAGGVQIIPGGVSSLNPGAGEVLVSADGNQMAAAYLDPTTNIRSASTYNVSTGQWTPLTGLGGYSTAPSTVANNGAQYVSTGTVWAMGSDGKFAAGQAYQVGNGIANSRAVIWNTQTNTVVNLGSNPYSTFGPNQRTRANGVSDDGRVAGGFGGNNTPLVWTDFDGDGVYTTVAVGAVNQVMAVSGNGLWAVGQGALGTNGGAAYRFNTATSTLSFLPQVNAALGADSATAVNTDGSVIVGYENVTGGAQSRAGFIWLADGTATGHSMSLDSFLAGYGIDTADTFNFATPLGISSNGTSTTIVGFGYANGSQIGEGFSVTVPYAAAVPETSTLAMLMAGLGALGFVARRRQPASRN